MNAIPIIPEKDNRHTERREGWHTPHDCFKLLDVQEAMKGVNERLDKGHARMGKIEETIERGAKTHARLEAKLDANNSVTDEIREILEGGKAFFRAVAKVGSWTRTVVLWVLPVVTAVLSFWYVITGQHK